jgi:hypothetical protein
MSPFVERASHWPATIGSFIAGAAGAALALLACFEVLPPVFVDPSGMEVAIHLLPFIGELSRLTTATCGPAGYIPDVGCWSSALLEAVSRATVAGVLLPRLAIVLVAGMVGGWMAAVRISAATPPRDRLIHLRGRRLRHGFDGRRSLRREVARAGRPVRSGLWLVPHVQLSREVESRNILALGTQGSGKTALLRGWVEQLVERSDRVVLHDVKGDFVGGLPAERMILWAPHDERSAAWDIGRDIVNRAAALEFATLSVKAAEHDAMWADGARALWADAVMVLIARCGEKWTLPQLYDLLTSSPQAFRDSLVETGAASAELIAIDDEGGVQRTSMSLLITLWVAAMTSLKPLADAWDDVPSHRRFSLRDWLSEDTRLPRVLVIARSAEYAALSSLAGALLIERLAGTILSPGRAIDPAQRIAFVLDEFAELGRLRRLPALLSVGREYGVIAIAALQDLGQLVEAYGETAARALEARFGIKAILRLSAGDTAERISKTLIGDRLVEYSEDRPAGAPPTWTPQVKRESHPAVGPERLESDLGVIRRSKTTLIRCMVTGIGDPALVDVPITVWPSRRAAVRPARWITGKAVEKPGDDGSAAPGRTG